MQLMYDWLYSHICWLYDIEHYLCLSISVYTICYCYIHNSLIPINGIFFSSRLCAYLQRSESMVLSFLKQWVVLRNMVENHFIDHVSFIIYIERTFAECKDTHEFREVFFSISKRYQAKVCWHILEPRYCELWWNIFVLHF